MKLKFSAILRRFPSIPSKPFPLFNYRKCPGQTETENIPTGSPLSKSDGGDGDKVKPDPVLPRPVRLEFPGKVRLGFIPEEWFTFFYEKTGVTGPYTFGVALATYLVSKEIYVLEHEYYSGLSVVVFWYFVVKKAGPMVARYLDKEINKCESAWNDGKENDIKFFQEGIADEERQQWSLEGQLTLVQAKRENVGLQLEDAYRQRLLIVHEQVKRRLDYQVEKLNVERRIAQKNLIQWVVKEVVASLTPEQEKLNIDKCIADLEAMMATKV